MGRRPAGELPAMRLDSRTGHARVRINGKTHWLGPWGSPPTQDRFDTLMAAFIASGRRNVDAGLADIEATRPNYRTTSLWHGAIAASRALVEVQRHLVSGMATTNGHERKPSPRVGKRFDRNAILRAVTRAIEKATRPQGRGASVALRAVQQGCWASRRRA